MWFGLHPSVPSTARGIEIPLQFLKLSRQMTVDNFRSIYWPAAVWEPLVAQWRPGRERGQSNIEIAPSLFHPPLGPVLTATNGGLYIDICENAHYELSAYWFIPYPRHVCVSGSNQRPDGRKYKWGLRRFAKGAGGGMIAKGGGHSVLTSFLEYVRTKFENHFIV